MTSPLVSDYSSRVYLRRMERRGKYRAYALFFGLVAIQCSVATFVVPAEPWWGRIGFAGVAAASVLAMLVAGWRLTQNREHRG